MKKIILNIILLVGTYLLPLYVFHRYQNDYNNTELRQNILFIVLFLGSALVTYLNNKYRKQDTDYKWIWVIFEILGVLGLLYSGVVLYLLFSFRNGIGF